MKHKVLTQPLTQLSLCISATLAMPVMADENQDSSPTANNVEIIEVQGIRQAYRGNVSDKDLPQAVSTISYETLELTGVNNLQDSLEFVSSVTRQNDFGGLWDMFAIRGFAGDENLPSAYLINGFSAGRGFSGNRDMSNVDQVEVLKGPTSALYGRGEPGGTVNITTKKPQFEQEGYLKLSAGSFNTYRAEGDYTNAITEDLAFRVNGAYEDADSYRDTVTKTKTVLTPSFLYRVNDRSLVSYELEYLSQEADMDRGIIYVEGKPFSDSLFYGEPADGPVEIDAIGHQLQLQHDLLNEWSFNAGLSYRTSSFEGSVTEPRWYDADENYVVRQRRYREFDAQDLSGRFEFSGSTQLFGLTHNLLIGGDAYEYELDRTILRYRHSGEPGDGADAYAVDFDAPVYRDTLPEMKNNTSDLEKQSGQGLYVQDQINLSDNWQAMVGLRYDNFDQEVIYRLNNNSTTEVSKSYVNPRVGVVYSISDDVRLYTSYSEGARPNSGVNSQGQGHDPEESKSYEIGLKWNLADQGFSGSTALFSTNKKNILASSPAGDGTTEAIGEAESKGLEIDMMYQPAADTVISMSYAYVDAQNAKQITLWDWYVIEQGARLGNVPEHSGSVMVRQYGELNGYQGSAGFVVRYVGEQLGDFLEQDYDLPSYTLVNLFMNSSLTDNIELNLNINNLLNEEYYSNSYFEAWTMPGSPRSISASVKYSF